MPGFTAESSLERSVSAFCAMVTAVRDQRVIVPQVWGDDDFNLVKCLMHGGDMRCFLIHARLS